MEKQTFAVASISCGHCVAAIEKELPKLEGVVDVVADSQAKTVSVKWDAPASAARIRERLNAIGYPAD